MEAFQERGISVPKDVALIRFDDIEEAQYATPPLTTLRQPFDEMGQQAIEMVLAMLNDRPVPEQVTMPLKLVVRQSCGCQNREVKEAVAGQPVVLREIVPTALIAPQERMLVEIVPAVAPPLVNLSPAWGEQLLDAYISKLGGAPSGRFRPSLHEQLRQVEVVGRNVNVWQRVISVLRRYTLPALDNAATRSRAEDLWQRARVMIGDFAQRTQAYLRFQKERQIMTLFEIGHILITSFDVAELMNLLARELSRLGIQRIYLSLYENPLAPTEWSRLVLACDETGRIDLEAGGRPFLVLNSCHLTCFTEKDNGV